ncbi:MAG: PilN domain-containing protein [Verrucomicrobium sp.]
MGASPQLQGMRLPGEETWETWLLDARGVWQKSARDEKAPEHIFAIDLCSLDSSPFWAPAGSEDRLAETAALRWEAMGLEADGNAGGGQQWAHWLIASVEDRLLVGTIALAEDAREDVWGKSLPSTFEISARLYPIPNDAAAIWMELGRLVMAIERNGQLLHTTVLASRKLDASAAGEVRDLMMGLEMQGLLPTLQGVHVWASAEPGFVPALQSALGTKVTEESKPKPHPPHQPSGLIPPAAATIRRQLAQARRQTLWLIAATCAVLSFFAAWTGWLMWRQQQLDAGLARLKVHAPQVAKVRESQLRWQALEAATDPQTYPVEVFDQIVALLPEEGIRFTDFTLDLDKITITGEATSAMHASKFQADVKGSEALHRFTFNTPVPTIRNDNRAIFRVEGSTEGGGTDHAPQ